METRINLTLENEELQSILRVVHAQLDAARAESEEQQSDLLELQDDFPEEPDQAFQSLTSIDNFEDLATLTQYIQPLSDHQKKQEETRDRIAALERMASTPYFARLDLRFEDEDEDESIYIGRATLWDDHHNILVHDWRSPIASMFYRFGTGDAYYDAPAGRIHCRLLRKRQYEIKHGVLKYCFDADTPIQDAYLRRMLSQGATQQMKTIVETIQRDQDAVIRDEKNELLMVQGVAGSGKTAIALHRVAYLMYEGLKNRLSAHNMLILSPNTLFERYISGVLPELSGRSVSTTTLEELIENLLHVSVQPRSERLDALFSAPDSRFLREKLAFKSSKTFLQLLDRFLDRLPDTHIAYRDVEYAGTRLCSREEVAQSVHERGNVLPLGTWLARYEAALWQQVHALRPARMEQLREQAASLGHGEEYARGCSIEESVALAGEIRQMTRLNALSLYHAFLSDERGMRALADGLPLPERLSEMLDDLPGDTLSFEDACAAAYIHIRLYGTPMRGDIRQIVVDEAQDYGLVDFALMNALFPRARFTVLGDIHQAMERSVDMSLYEGVREVLKRRTSVLVELTRSFRCTKDILEYSRRFLPGVTVESFNRPGDTPRVLPASEIVREVNACRERGLRSIALIAKTQSDAQRWQERLKPDLPVRLMGRDTFSGDVFVIALPLSKGLEFDAVLVLDCDAQHYSAPEDRRALYVACTRALNTLLLFHEDPVSPLLADGAKEA